MLKTGITKYQIAKTTGDDATFVGRVVEGKKPMPDRLRLVIAERLGHASVEITLRIYSHVLPGLQREAAEKVASLLDPAKTVHKVSTAGDSETG